ncbi:hypothetical protein LLG96_14660 [bacterium]|nr:hypothetical protein [bacterium]
MGNESIYFRFGRQIGYWYAANRSRLHREIIRGILRQLPGGQWLTRFFM